MQTHDDADAPKGMFKQFEEAVDMRKLEDLAARMTAAGDNQITAGAPGEEALWASQVGTIFVRRLPDDELALRVSIGEGHRISDSAYLVFRGDPHHVTELLERCLSAMRAAF